jgi:nucleoside-diphosphate-sugar epimerase
LKALVTGGAGFIGSHVVDLLSQLCAVLCLALGVLVTPRQAPRRAGDVRDAYFDVRRAEREPQPEHEALALR